MVIWKCKHARISDLGCASTLHTLSAAAGVRPEDSKIGEGIDSNTKEAGWIKKKEMVPGSG